MLNSNKQQQVIFFLIFFSFLWGDEPQALVSRLSDGPGQPDFYWEGPLAESLGILSNWVIALQK